MELNVDAIMVVFEDETCKAVTWDQYKKLSRIDSKAVMISLFRNNPTGTTPFRDNFSGHDIFQIYYNNGLDCISVSETDSGANDGAREVEFDRGQGAKVRNWPTKTNQAAVNRGVPFLAVENPTNAQIAMAQAKTLSDGGFVG